MPKYKKRDPEYTAIQFTGSNIREVMDELGPKFYTHHGLDLENATSFTLYEEGMGQEVRKGNWIIVDRERGIWYQKNPEMFELLFEPIKRVGRPPKEKK